MRKFDTGATRDEDAEKLDFEGFLSPLALRRYAIYLNKHRTQADGKCRDSDNWQKGIPTDVYMKSMFRHFFDTWTIHRGGVVINAGEVSTKQEALCALLFNVMGYLHELEKKKESDDSTSIDDPERVWIRGVTDCQTCPDQGERCLECHEEKAS